MHPKREPEHETFRSIPDLVANSDMSGSRYASQSWKFRLLSVLYMSILPSDVSHL